MVTQLCEARDSELMSYMERVKAESDGRYTIVKQWKKRIELTHRIEKEDLNHMVY